MSNLTREKISIIKHDFERLLENLCSEKCHTNSLFQQDNFAKPSIKLLETDNEIIIQVELKGINENNISLEVDNNILALRKSGGTKHTIQLPFEFNQENISAQTSKDALTIKLPRTILK